MFQFLKGFFSGSSDMPEVRDEVSKRLTEIKELSIEEAIRQSENILSNGNYFLVTRATVGDLWVPKLPLGDVTRRFFEEYVSISDNQGFTSELARSKIERSKIEKIGEFIKLGTDFEFSSVICKPNSNECYVYYGVETSLDDLLRSESASIYHWVIEQTI